MFYLLCLSPRFSHETQGVFHLQLSLELATSKQILPDPEKSLLSYRGPATSKTLKMCSVRFAGLQSSSSNERNISQLWSSYLKLSLTWFTNSVNFSWKRNLESYLARWQALSSLINTLTGMIKSIIFLDNYLNS